MPKPEWMYECHWSFTTPLIVKAPNWKHYPLNQFHSEHIINLRMRGYVLEYPTPLEFLLQVQTSKISPVHVVMYDNNWIGVSV